MEIALGALPTLSGHLAFSSLVIILPCSSICNKKGASPTLNKKSTQFCVKVSRDLALMDLATASYQLMSLSMVNVSANHVQICLVIRSQYKRE